MHDSPFPAFDYMRFARTEMQGARHELCMSGVEPVDAATLEAAEADAGLEALPFDAGPELHETWEGLLAERYQVPPASAIPVLGASGGIYVALAALHSLLPAGPVAIERPAYGAFECAARLVGRPVAQLERLASEDYALDLGRVEAAFAAGTRVLCLTDLQNPCGCALDAEAEEALHAIAARHDAWIVLDEVYRDYRPVRVGSAYREDGRIVAVSSLTKCYGLGGPRAGWLFGPPEIVDRADRVMEILHGVYPVSSGVLAVRGLRCADALLARARRIVARARPVMDAWVAGTAGVGWVPPDGGMTGLVQVEGLSDSLRFARRLRAELDCQVVPGSFFGAEGALRISFGLAPARLQQALDVLALGLGPLVE